MTTARMDLHQRLVEAGALNPRYAADQFGRLIWTRSSPIPMARDSTRVWLDTLCQEDPAVEPVLRKEYLPSLKRARVQVREFTQLLDEIEPYLLSEEQQRVYLAVTTDLHPQWPKKVKVYDGAPTEFYQQQALFDFLDQQTRLGKGFRRPSYRVKIDESTVEDCNLWEIARHSGAFWAEHDFKSPIEYTDVSYHLPAMQSVVATRTWDDTHPQGPAIIVRLHQYGSDENTQKVVGVIREGAQR